MFNPQFLKTVRGDYHCTGFKPYPILLFQSDFQHSGNAAD